MAPAHESETIVFNFRKLLSTLPNYAELEQILLFSVNWGKQVCNFNDLKNSFLLLQLTAYSYITQRTRYQFLVDLIQGVDFSICQWRVFEIAQD
jgi:hypothetical protein